MLLTTIAAMAALRTAAPPPPPPLAALRFAHSYGDHMVLQQAPKQAIVWGYCGAKGCSGVEVCSNVHSFTPTEMLPVLPPLNPSWLYMGRDTRFMVLS